MLSFRKWLEDAGPVTLDRLTDPDKLPYRTKYTAGKQDKKTAFKPERLFGKKRKMRKNG